MIASASTAWVGTLSGWLTLAAVLGAAYIFSRGAGGSAISSLETANRVLDKDNEHLKTQVIDLTKTVAELRSKTNVAEALQPLAASIAHHEERAQARFEQTSVILELVAERLDSQSP